MRLLLLFSFFMSCPFLFGQNDFNYYFNQGQEKFEKENYMNALNDFSNALSSRNSAKNDYAIANAYRARALCKMHLKNFSSAINDISDAIKLKPEYSDLYYSRSIIHLGNKQYDECIIWADKGLILKPEFEELLLTKAKAYLSKKNYAESLNNLDTLLIKINPRNVDGWNLKGHVKQKQKDYKASEMAFTKAIEIDAQNYAAFFDRGICRAEMKDFEGAMSDMNKGMALDSTAKWVAYNNIAFFIKFNQKDYQGAIALFNQAIMLNPTFSYAYNNRGYAKIQLNDLKGAREDITKAIIMNDKNSYAHKTYALLLFAEKKDKQACEKLKKALDLGYTEEYDEEVNELIKKHCK